MNYEGIIAVCIAVLGWLITYWLNVIAQRKAFLNQIQNSARLDISKALRNYQSWLAKINGKSKILYNPLFTIGDSNDVSEQLNKDKKNFTDALFAPNANNWIITLEEYEILFPETRNVRMQLCDRHRIIHDELVKYSLDHEKQIDYNLLLDQMFLIEDLRIYLQNKSLTKITGYEIPAREPKDPKFPKIIHHKGKLEIMEEQKTDVSEIL